MIRAFALAAALLAPPPAAADFVLSNLRFTLYHEIGHAVIDQARVPVFGPEETMADGFALVLADRLHPEGEMADLITEMTRLGRAEAAEELFEPWEEYMPGAQRTAWSICVWYGLNPRERGDLAHALGMPADRDRQCAETGRALRSAWGPVLDRLRPGPGDEGTLSAGRTGKALRLLSRDIDRLNDALALPRRTPMTVENCGQDNAYYYHYDDRIVFCSEMVDALLRRAAR